MPQKKALELQTTLDSVGNRPACYGVLGMWYTLHSPVEAPLLWWHISWWPLLWWPISCGGPSCGGPSPVVAPPVVASPVAAPLLWRPLTWLTEPAYSPA